MIGGSSGFARCMLRAVAQYLLTEGLLEAARTVNAEADRIMPPAKPGFVIRRCLLEGFMECWGVFRLSKAGKIIVRNPKDTEVIGTLVEYDREEGAVQLLDESLLFGGIK